jgi:hypothetical protein
MLRRRTDPFQIVAGERTDALKQSLASLIRDVKALNAGEDANESFRAVFRRAVNLSDQTTREWLPQWTRMAEESRSGLTPAYRVIAASIKTLSTCVDTYARSLVLNVSSPDPSEHRNGASESDGELAHRATDRCLDAAQAALRLIDDIPAIKKKRTADIQIVLDDCESTYRQTSLLAELVRDRLDEVMALPD